MKEYFEILENNDECVVVKALNGFEDELFCLGFSHQPRLIRLTKGDSQECTIKYADGGSLDWEWGMGGHTLVSDGLRNLGIKIQNMIEYEFGIPVTWRHTKTDSRREYFEMDKAAYLRAKKGV